MKVIQGVAACEGIAVGRLHRYPDHTERKISKIPSENIHEEVERLLRARTSAEKRLNYIYKKTIRNIGKEDSLIFKIHILMLQDEEYFDIIKSKIISEQVKAEYAVWVTTNQFYKIFTQLEDEYMRARGDDIMDISRHLLHYLDPAFEDRLKFISEEAIIGITELMPSEAVQINRRKTLGILSKNGSRNSHSSILLRTMEIPTVVGLGDDYEQLSNAAAVIIDGFTGDVIIDPDEDTCVLYREKQNLYIKHQRALKNLRGCEAVTKDGYKIEIHANISHPDDVVLVLDNDANGIGLFRTEYLFMNGETLPDEELQFQAYKAVLQKMKNGRVVVRTPDMGENGYTSFLGVSAGDNPAMGYRAIRVSLDRKDFFTTQLRALLRASVYGNLAIMFPIITTEEEIVEAKKVVEEVKTQLTAQGIPVAEQIEIGAMIETPAAVLISDILAKHVDFFSIGTNDLTQYTLATDRSNPHIASIYNPKHQAVLRMIKMTVDNAKKNGIWTGICGESAADLMLTSFYIGVGIDELSVSPSAVLEIRKLVREMTLSEAKEEANKLLGEGYSYPVFPLGQFNKIQP